MKNKVKKSCRPNHSKTLKGGWFITADFYKLPAVSILPGCLNCVPSFDIISSSF